MNDDFLHRLRKTPPPEFLAGLKARLDQRSVPPPPRRFSFTRGLITGLLLAGGMFAVAAAFTDELPEPIRAFVKAPQQLLARLFSGERAAEQGQDSNRRKAIPLGPVWLPERSGSAPGSVDSGVPPPPTQLASQGGSTVASSQGMPASPVFAGPDITISASPEIYPQVVFAIGHSSQIKVELDSDRSGFARLCGPGAPGPAQMIALTRRITADESRTCNQHGGNDLVELKVGYQAIALVRARLYGTLRLSARDLFRALARRIPDPNNPERLVDNPYTNWNQIDPALPYDRIRVIGPAATSPSDKLAAELLLGAGCNTYPWIKALRDSDLPRYEEICQTLRNDGAYEDRVGSGWSNTEQLVGNPTAIGVFSPLEFQQTLGELLLNTIDGVEPAVADIAAGSYPLARPVYLYASKSAVFRVTRAYGIAVRMNMGPPPYGAYSWGFLPLDAAERAATIKATDIFLRF